MSSSAVCVSVVILVFSSRPGRLCRPLDNSRLLSLSLVFLSLSCLHFTRMCLCVFSCFVFLCSCLLLFFIFSWSFLQLHLVSDVSLYLFLVVCVLFFSGLQPVFHSFIWSFVVVVWFVTLIVSHPLKFPLWPIFLLVIFLILSSSFAAFVFVSLVLGVVTLAWSIRFLLLLSNLGRWSRNTFLDKLTVLRFLFNLRAAVLFMTPRLLDVDSNLRVKALLDISFTGCSLGERSHTGITVTQPPLCYKCKHFSSQLELQIPLK